MGMESGAESEKVAACVNFSEVYPINADADLLVVDTALLTLSNVCDKMLSYIHPAGGDCIILFKYI